jgi:hypothetical protein
MEVKALIKWLKNNVLLSFFVDGQVGPRSKKTLVLILLYICFLIPASLLLTWDGAIVISSPKVITSLVLFGCAVAVIFFFQFGMEQNPFVGDGFRVPFVPWVPCFAIGINILMAMAHLSWQSWAAFGVWIFVGNFFLFIFFIFWFLIGNCRDFDLHLLGNWTFQSPRPGSQLCTSGVSAGR